MVKPIRPFRGLLAVPAVLVLILGWSGCRHRLDTCVTTYNGDYTVPVSWTSGPLGPINVSKTGGYGHHGAQITFYTTDGSTLQRVQVPDPPGGPNPYPNPVPSASVWTSGPLDTSIAECQNIGFVITLAKGGQTKPIYGRIIINK